MKRLGLLFFMGYMVSGGVAQAATYYVSKNGNNNNSCTAALSTSTPKLTINAGIGCLKAGDTLLVRAGTYAEAITSVPSGTSWTSKVRIANYNGETVWLAPTSGDNAVNLNAGQAYIEFDGINMRGPAPGAVISFGPTTHHLRVQNAELVNDKQPGMSGIVKLGLQGSSGPEFHEFIHLDVHGGGGPYAFYVLGNNNLIDGCDMHHLNSAGVHIYNSGGNPTGNIVRNSIIRNITTSSFGTEPDDRVNGIIVNGSGNQLYNNLIYGINLASGAARSGSAGIHVFSGSGHKVWNNTIYQHERTGIYIFGGASNVEVRNNIAFNNGDGDYQNSGSGTVQSNNLFGVDPLFANPAGNDFTVKPNSRAIDQAASVSAVKTDLVGTMRPQGSAPDIGAFEQEGQQASGPPAPPANVRIIN